MKNKIVNDGNTLFVLLHENGFKRGIRVPLSDMCGITAARDANQKICGVEFTGRGKTVIERIELDDEKASVALLEGILKNMVTDQGSRGGRFSRWGAPVAVGLMVAWMTSAMMGQGTPAEEPVQQTALTMSAETDWNALRDAAKGSQVIGRPDSDKGGFDRLFEGASGQSQD